MTHQWMQNTNFTHYVYEWIVKTVEYDAVAMEILSINTFSAVLTSFSLVW